MKLSKRRIYDFLVFLPFIIPALIILFTVLYVATGLNNYFGGDTPLFFLLDHLFSSFLIVCPVLFVYFTIDLIRNKEINPIIKVIWLIEFVVLNFLLLPLYYFLHFRQRTSLDRIYTLSPRKYIYNTNFLEMIVLLCMLPAIMFLWNTKVIYPVKLLVVFFHELSHGIVVLLTLEKIKEIDIDPYLGGHIIYTGGIPFLIAYAGYLGSLIWGGAILILATRAKRNDKIIAGLGVLMILTAYAFMRKSEGIGMLFCVITGSAMIGAGVFVPRKANDFILKFIGLASCFYVMTDIHEDLLFRSFTDSDAYHLFQMTHIPAEIWGTWWIFLSITLTLLFLFMACRKREEENENRL